MANIDPTLVLLMNLSKVQALIARKFDGLAAHGISFSDFMILYLIQQAAEKKVRRIDLANKLGLTASAVTRSLLPMEKIGLVARELNERDARVSYVTLTAAGRQLFADAEPTANGIAQEIIRPEKMKKIKPLTELLSDLGGNIL